MSHDQLPQETFQPTPDEVQRRETAAQKAELGDYEPDAKNPNKGSHWVRRMIATAAVAATAAGAAIGIGIMKSHDGNNASEKRPVAAAPGHEHKGHIENDPKKWNSDNAPTTWIDKDGQSKEYRGVDEAAQAITISHSEYPTAIEKAKRFFELTNQLANYGDTSALQEQDEDYVSDDSEFNGEKLNGTDAVAYDFAGHAYRQGLMDPSSTSGNSFATKIVELNIGYVAENRAESKTQPGTQPYRLELTPETSKTANGLGIEVIDASQPGTQKAMVYFKYEGNAERAGVSPDHEVTGQGTLTITWQIDKNGVAKVIEIDEESPSL